MSSRITVKKNLIIFHHPGDWIEIYQKILHEYGIGMAVRTKLRRELGFTYRHHRGLVRNDIAVPGEPGMHYEDQIHVDFYNQAAQSWFQLKYLNL
jgi:hypothetical protein